MGEELSERGGRGGGGGGRFLSSGSMWRETI